MRAEALQSCRFHVLHAQRCDRALCRLLQPPVLMHAAPQLRGRRRLRVRRRGVSAVPRRVATEASASGSVDLQTVAGLQPHRSLAAYEQAHEACVGGGQGGVEEAYVRLRGGRNSKAEGKETRKRGVATCE